MAEIGRWNGHKFEVSSTVIRGFTGLTIKGSSETEDKKSSNQKYVKRKNGKPTEVSLTVALNTQLGCNVRAEALSFVEEAQAGKKDYFYVSNKKLVTCQLMLTEASVSSTEITNGGVWTRAEVKLTMKQCSKNNGSSGSSGSSGGGSSGRKTTSKKTSVKTTGVISTIANGIKGAVTGVINGVKNAVTTVKNVLTGKTSFATALTSAVKKGVQAVKAVSSAAKVVSAVKKAVTSTSAVLTIKKIVNNVKKK